jgi:hypothetical protein
MSEDPKPYLPTGMLPPEFRAGGYVAQATRNAVLAELERRDDAWRAALEQARIAAVEEYRERVVAWLLREEEHDLAQVAAMGRFPLAAYTTEGRARARALIKDVRRAR